MPLLGPVIGPVAGGAIAETKGWQWTFWFSVFTLGIFGVLFFFFYRETYDVTLLRRKAARLQQGTQNIIFRCRHDDPSTDSAAAKFTKTFIRPLKIMWMPAFLLVAFPAALYMSFVYVLATTMTDVFSQAYDFSETASGLSFLGIAFGMAFGALVCSWLLDAYSKRVARASATADNPTPNISPESRIPLTISGYILGPIGLVLYGWPLAYASRGVPWIVPILGSGVLGFALYLVSVPATTYLADAFGTYRASAMAALMTLRNAMCIIVPLAGPPLYMSLGYGWGNSLLAFIAFVFIFAPFTVVRYGSAMRRRSAWMEEG